MKRWTRELAAGTAAASTFLAGGCGKPAPSKSPAPISAVAVNVEVQKITDKMNASRDSEEFLVNQVSIVAVEQYNALLSEEGKREKIAALAKVIAVQPDAIRDELEKFIVSFREKAGGDQNFVYDVLKESVPRATMQTAQAGNYRFGDDTQQRLVEILGSLAAEVAAAKKQGPSK